MSRVTSAVLICVVQIGLWTSGSECAERVLPPITAVAFAPGGSLLIVGSQAGVEIRSYPQLELVRRLETSLPHVHDLAFTPDGTVLAAAGGIPANEGVVELYDWPSGELADRQTTSADLVYDVVFNSDAAQCAVAGLDRFVTVHEILRDESTRFGKTEQILQGHSRGVLAVEFLTSPQGDVIVSAAIDHSLRVWSSTSGQLVRTLDNHTAEVRDLAVRPNQQSPLPMIGSASKDRTVRLWQPTIGRLVRFARLSAEPLAIDWTPDGNRLLVSCTDGHLRVVDPDTVQVQADHEALDGWAYVVASALDGKTAVIGGSGGQLKSIDISDD